MSLENFGEENRETLGKLYEPTLQNSQLRATKGRQRMIGQGKQTLYDRGLKELKALAKGDTGFAHYCTQFV